MSGIGYKIHLIEMILVPFHIIVSNMMVRLTITDFVNLTVLYCASNMTKYYDRHDYFHLYLLKAHHSNSIFFPCELLMDGLFFS